MSSSVTTKLNDVQIEAVVSLVQKISQEPEAAATRWQAQVNWKGGFRSEASIRDFAPAASDEPDTLGGTDTGPNPVEQVLGALGNCLAVGYAANATVAGITIDNMSIIVEGDLDLHTFLGMKEGNAGYDNISVKVTLDCDASPEALAALHEKVINTSPVGHTLSRPVPVNIELA